MTFCLHECMYTMKCAWSEPLEVRRRHNLELCNCSDRVREQTPKWNAVVLYVNHCVSSFQSKLHHLRLISQDL